MSSWVKLSWLCFMLPVAAHAGRGSWTSRGPAGVEVTGIAVSPPDAQRVWAATKNGGVFRSDDGGFAWTKTAFEGEELAIAADPNDRDTAYVLSESNSTGSAYGTRGQCYRTADAGQTWSRGADTGVLTRLAPDPKTSGVLYATGDEFHLGSGTYKSLDGGETWNALELGFFAIPGAIAVDSRVPSRIYDAADIFSSGVWRSDDGGENWQATGPIDDIAASEIVVGNDASSTPLVVGTKGVWRSVDLGAHWRLIEGLPPARPAVDPRFEGVVYAASLSSNGEFFVSRDAGATWSPLTSSGFPGEPILDFVASNSGRLFAAATSGVFELDLVSVLPVERRQPITIQPRFHPQP